MTDPRTQPPLVADERATLAGFLDWQRQTLALKCAGLTPAQLAERPVPPSAMSLLGLVRHLTENERGWFLEVLDGQDVPLLYGAGDADITGVDPEGVDAAEVTAVFDTWNAECAQSREVVARLATLDAIGKDDRGREFSARWIITHMIEEYARHNGHADFLRERIDGATGE
ncbi:DinB family protein [Pseudonocardia sp. GCM10023141]|uniref:DinB family protein n=1 Tax=Pseudonocardia sp. GCM10023141 TaxID=3252653 RepID=UPI0036204F9B